MNACKVRVQRVAHGMGAVGRCRKAVQRGSGAMQTRCRYTSIKAGMAAVAAAMWCGAAQTAGGGLATFDNTSSPTVMVVSTSGWVLQLSKTDGSLLSVAAVTAPGIPVKCCSNTATSNSPTRAPLENLENLAK